MTAYAIGHITITDPEKYKNYEVGFFAALAPFDGSIVAVDDAPLVLEGEAPNARVVVLSFPDHETLNAWYNSDAYQAIASIRHEAAESKIITIREFELPT